MELPYDVLLQTKKIETTFIFDLACMLSNDASRVRPYYKQFMSGKYPSRIQKEDGYFGVSPEALALLDKIDSMISNRRNFQSVICMLYSFRFGTKRKLHSYRHGYAEKKWEWTYKDGNEKQSNETNDTRAHFRWDYGTRYTLSDRELQAIEAVLGFVDEELIAYNPRTRQPKLKEVSDIQSFLDTTKTTVTFKYKGIDEKTKSKLYNFVIENQKYKFENVFHVGSADNSAVTVSDILYNLERFEPNETWEDFAEEFSYNVDSRKDYKIYENVLNEWKSVNKLFTEKEIETLNEILTDY